MSARLLATGCLVLCCVGFGQDVPNNTRAVPIGLYLKADVTSLGLPFAQAQDELQQLIDPAGLEAVWLNQKQAGSADVAKLVSVELRGSCGFDQELPGTYKNHTPLASTAVVDGKVLPFVWVDCNQLQLFLQDKIARLSPEIRGLAWGRAMARLLAHELYHVLTAEESHTRAGVTKEKLTAADLLGDHLNIEPAAVARLTPPASEAPVVLARANPVQRPNVEAYGVTSTAAGTAALASTATESVSPEPVWPAGSWYENGAEDEAFAGR